MAHNQPHLDPAGASEVKAANLRCNDRVDEAGFHYALFVRLIISRRDANEPIPRQVVRVACGLDSNRCCPKTLPESDTINVCFCFRYSKGSSFDTVTPLTPWSLTILKNRIGLASAGVASIPGPKKKEFRRDTDPLAQVKRHHSLEKLNHLANFKLGLPPMPECRGAKVGKLVLKGGGSNLVRSTDSQWVDDPVSCGFITGPQTPVSVETRAVP
ncbi:hypothetical protein BKA70DRAFT_1404884 [Coprinopsis sp. MPI-PUGE-AT-0042]|nr:hypothetical protein BKA70DRAFT_1404884 [Coprinopsis sp. MPI-PUGE-AT-0042]